MDLIPLLISAVSGGVITKAIDLLATRNERRLKLKYDEKEYLINEIDRLKTNVDELRQEVGSMRIELNEKMEINSYLITRWFELKTLTAKLLTHLRYNHPDTLPAIPDLVSEIDKQIINSPNTTPPPV